jgi:hypothetical protein
MGTEVIQARYLIGPISPLKDTAARRFLFFGAMFAIVLSGRSLSIPDVLSKGKKRQCR